jgi:transposase
MGSITSVFSIEDYVIADTRSEGSGIVIAVRQRRPRRPRCPHCGHRRPWKHDSRTRRVAHLPVGQRRCDLELTVQRYRCPRCTRTFTPELPGMPRRARLSAALRSFVNFVIIKLRVALVRVQDWLQLGWNTLWRCLADPQPPPLDELRHLCLDEVYFCEPQRFLTILSDAEHGQVLGQAQGRGERPSRQLLTALPADVRANVDTLATDLQAGQRKAAYDCLPAAEVCADCFHVMRLARRAVREALPAQKEATRLAVRQLRRIMQTKDQPGFLEWLRDWASASGSLERLHQTLEQWQLEIESYLATGRTTGPAEALNRKIALLRRIACGYTNLDNFSKRISLLNYSPHPER